MARALEQAVETHGSIPVEEVHNFGQIFRLRRFDEIVDVVGHNAEGVQFELILVGRFLNRIEEHLPTVAPR